MKYHRTIEVVANLAIIAVAATLGVVLIKGHFWPAADNHQSHADEVVIGKTLNVPGVDWASNKRTMLVALQKGCRFCTESAPFYKELAQRQSATPNLKLIAVFPTSVEDSRAYLDSLGVPIEEVKQARLDSIKGTPTILMVDSNGVVTGAWKGRLDDAHQAEVLAQL